MIPPEPLRIHPPTTAAVPLVLDSPHSGQWLPPDLPLAVPEWDLRESEDQFVDRLWAGAPALGATLLTAGFSRVWVDPNRHAGDVDPDLLDRPWPYEWHPSGKARIGKAVVWRTLEDGRPIYARRLAPAEIRQRIEAGLLPYQRALADLIGQTHARHGVCLHLNCHSMRATAGPMGEGGAGARRADIVLGDRDGTTCAASLTALVRDTLRGYGYSVAVNDPYKGVELVRAYADPARGRHSLQIELNKRLYMDETSRQPAAGFDALRGHLGALLTVLADHARTLAP